MKTPEISKKNVSDVGFVPRRGGFFRLIQMKVNHKGVMEPDVTSSL